MAAISRATAQAAEPRRVSMSRCSHASADDRAHQARPKPKDSVTIVNVEAPNRTSPSLQKHAPCPIHMLPFPVGPLALLDKAHAELRLTRRDLVFVLSRRNRSVHEHGFELLLLAV